MNEIEKEQRRYEIAKSVLQGLIAHHGDVKGIDYSVKSAVSYADALLEELQKKCE